MDKAGLLLISNPILRQWEDAMATGSLPVGLHAMLLGDRGIKAGRRG